MDEAVVILKVAVPFVAGLFSTRDVKELTGATKSGCKAI